MKLPDIPPIANGTYLPPGIEMQITKEEERQKQMDNIQIIAENSAKQAKIAEEASKSSTKYSKISISLSVMAIIISIVTIVMSILYG